MLNNFCNHQLFLLFSFKKINYQNIFNFIQCGNNHERCFSVIFQIFQFFIAQQFCPLAITLFFQDFAL